jgi:hypothetical protein
VVSAIRRSFGLGSDRENLPDLRDVLAEPGLDALLEGNCRRGTALAGPAESEQKGPVLVVEIHHFNLTLVGGDIGTKSVEGSLDTVEDLESIHTPKGS